MADETCFCRTHRQISLIHILHYMYTFTQMSDKGCVLMHAMLLVGSETRQMEIAVIMHSTRNCRWRHVILVLDASLGTKTNDADEKRKYN